MTEKKPAARKEIGDVAMGYDDDAGNAGVVRTRHVTFDGPGQELALEGGGTLAAVHARLRDLRRAERAHGQRDPRLRTRSRATRTSPAATAPNDKPGLVGHA